MNRIRLGPVVQVCWYVNDIESAMRRWIDEQGVGPFYIHRHMALQNVVYRGQPSEVDFDLAIAHSGGIQIELIQQHDDRPSVFRELFPGPAEGFHHICYIVDDLQEAIAHFERLNQPLCLSARLGPIDFAYSDTRAGIGCLTELVSRRPEVEAIFKMVADAAIDWDGKDPIRAL